MKDYKSALQSYQQALQIRFKLLGENHVNTAESYHEIGVTQHEIKDYKSALQSYQKQKAFQTTLNLNREVITKWESHNI